MAITAQGGKKGNVSFLELVWPSVGLENKIIILSVQSAMCNVVQLQSRCVQREREMYSVPCEAGSAQCAWLGVLGVSSNLVHCCTPSLC